MIINEQMSLVLDQIKENESAYTSKQLCGSSNQLGNRLIVLYYKTNKVNTRELITEFMTQAGIVWLRKLLTKDTRPIASSSSPFASMSDYLGLLAANDNDMAPVLGDTA